MSKYTLGDTCLLARQNTVTVGVITSIRTSLVKGKEFHDLSVIYVGLNGEEREVFVVPDQICEIDYYNTQSLSDFTREIGGKDWAAAKATALKTTPPAEPDPIKLATT